jgi:hypothetical protein
MLDIVNGYICYNCTDVANAKKNIDPAHPKEDAAQKTDTAGKTKVGPAVILSDALTAIEAVDATASKTSATGTKLNLSV